MAADSSASSTDVSVTVNGAVRSVAAGSSVGALVEMLGFAGRPIAVEVDGLVVPRAALEGRAIAGGERIEIVTFVGGG